MERRLSGTSLLWVINLSKYARALPEQRLRHFSLIYVIKWSAYFNNSRFNIRHWSLSLNYKMLTYDALRRNNNFWRVMNNIHKELDNKIKSGEEFEKLWMKTLEEDRTKVISFVNPYSYLTITKSSNDYSSIDHFFSDGSLHCAFHNFFSKKKISRASFDFSSDVPTVVFRSSIVNDLPLAVIGATHDENIKSTEVLKSQFEGLPIVYKRNGYFKDDLEKEQLVKDIEERQVKIVLVGMGTPYQEDLSIYLKQRLGIDVTIITCGGFLTQTSIKADYYHSIIKKFGLRWLQRFVMHKHVRQRVLNDYPKFIFSYIIHHLKIGR